MEIWLVKFISFLGYQSQQNFDQPYLNEYLDSCGHKKMAQRHKVPLNSARNSVFTILYQQKICKHKVGIKWGSFHVPWSNFKEILTTTSSVLVWSYIAKLVGIFCQL